MHILHEEEEEEDEVGDEDEDYVERNSKLTGSRSLLLSNQLDPYKTFSPLSEAKMMKFTGDDSFCVYVIDALWL